MANKIEVKAKGNVQKSKKQQPNSLKVPIEAKATPMNIKQGTGLKTPNLVIKMKFDTKKA